MKHPHRLTFAASFLLSALAAAICAGQDVPQGVNYKKATPEINAKAKLAIEQALSGNEIPTRFLSDTVSCGPILWNDLKNDHEVLSKDSTPVTGFLSLPDPVQVEGRGFRTQEQHERFWKLVVEKYPELRKSTVRPARANEIQFYWATIPFDIEEPFFAIETPNYIFIANLKVEKDTTTLFWIDRVDDLKKLKK
jgi:hypothetical protein